MKFFEKPKPREKTPGTIVLICDSPEETHRFHSDDMQDWWQYYCEAYLRYGVEWIHIGDIEEPETLVSIQAYRIREVRRIPDTTQLKETANATHNS